MALLAPCAGRILDLGDSVVDLLVDNAVRAVLHRALEETERRKKKLTRTHHSQEQALHSVTTLLHPPFPGHLVLIAAPARVLRRPRVLRVIALAAQSYCFAGAWQDTFADPQYVPMFCQWHHDLHRVDKGRLLWHLHMHLNADTREAAGRNKGYILETVLVDMI